LNTLIFIRIVKAVYRRIYWAISFCAKRLGFSIVFFDQISFKGLSIGKITPDFLLAEFFSKFQPVDNGFELIRIGNNGDGGYLLPDDFVGISHCFSAGCDLAWTFEKHLDVEYGIFSEILDSLDKKPLDLGPSQNYTPAWLGHKNSLNSITLDTWLNNQVGSRDSLILQMDIEGFEWQIFSQISDKTLNRFRTIVVEFHNLDNLLNYKLFRNSYEPAITNILRNFDVVHFHPNNCCGQLSFGDCMFPRVFEVTFHNRSRAKFIKNQRSTPNALDVKNVSENNDIEVDWNLLTSSATRQ